MCDFRPLRIQYSAQPLIEATETFAKALFRESKSGAVLYERLQTYKDGLRRVIAW